MLGQPTMAEAARLAEPVEVAAWADFCGNAPADVIEEAGVGTLRVGDVLASRASKYDVVAINRVCGLGVAVPATEAALDRMLSVYVSDPPARVAVQVCPTAEPAALTGWLQARGFEFLNNWVRLCARVELLPAERESGAIHIERVDAAGAASFGRICADAFGWPAVFGRWTSSIVGRPGWQNFMAFENGAPIGTGSLYTTGSVGWLGMAATHAAFRRRGSQSALLHRRFRVARELGCEWLVVETAEDRPDKPAQSYRNLRRLGFEAAYLRANWIQRRALA
jgi:GNAT superfamily N-acetyltransferase